MELLCVCGQINQTALPDYCMCRRCGRIWKYERTTYANDWRCICLPNREPSGPPSDAVRAEDVGGSAEAGS